MNDIIIHSPIKVSSADQQKIKLYLGKTHSIKGNIRSVLDKSLIGGIKITYKDNELDLSIKGKLARLSTLFD